MFMSKVRHGDAGMLIGESPNLDTVRLAFGFDNGSIQAPCTSLHVVAIDSVACLIGLLGQEFEIVTDGILLAEGTEFLHGVKLFTYDEGMLLSIHSTGLTRN